MASPNNSPAGRFPEGGALDRLDKALSGPIFRLVLPAPAEVALSMPGAWFGCGPYALGLAPLLLAASVGRDTPKAKLVGLPLAAGIGLWLKKALAPVEELKRGRGLTHIYIAFYKSPVVSLGTPHMVMGVIHAMGFGGYTRAPVLYMSSWFLVQALIEGVKGLVWRRRPTVALRDELDSVHRALPELGHSTRVASQANLSFPSGDAAGAAAFGVALALAAPELRAPALTVAALSAFGRVYFHCHHLLDVSVGSCIGACVVLLMNRCRDLCWGHVLLAEVFTMAIWMPLQKLKPKAS